MFKASKLVESNKKHCTAESLLKVHANICTLVVVHLASISCLLINLVDLFLQKINLLNYQSLIWTVYKTSKTYKDESKSSTLMFNMTFLSDMEVDTKKKDESQPSRILASCRTSVDRVCSMEFLKERLLQHPTSNIILPAICTFTQLDPSSPLTILKDRFPPLVWAPSYNLDMLTGDFIAGVTTALTVIPQGIGIFIIRIIVRL